MSMVLRPIEVVGGNDDELLLFVCQLMEELKHLLGGLEIEEIGGFVEEHDGRVLCHSARQHHALSLTIGEGVHGTRCQMGNAATMQHIVHKKRFRLFAREKHGDAAHCPQKAGSSLCEREA